MIFDKAFSRARNAVDPLSLVDPTGWRAGSDYFASGTQTPAMKVATVNACVEIRSDTMGKLPFFVMDENTKEHVNSHRINYLLSTRPNEHMTPFVFKKLLESQRLLTGNAYALIVTNKATGRPVELLPLLASYMSIWRDKNNLLWYVYCDPVSGISRKFAPYEIIHLKAYSEDGITGISILSRASRSIQNAGMQQDYENKFYTQNARPAGVLEVVGDLSLPAKEKIRSEWENIYGGVNNAFRVAILDNAMKYQQIGMSQKDAQFVESKDCTIQDIARFFGVPLYKLQSGKQSYSSNEQNAIEYVVSTIHPTVQQWEEEFSFKMLFDPEIEYGLWVKINMNAELRGDMTARGAWYTSMRNNGAYSVDDIRGFEDLPKVPGGSTRIVPLNNVPLEKAMDYFEAMIQKMKGGKQ